MFYNSSFQTWIQQLSERHPPSALWCPIKREKLGALKNSKAFLAQISQEDTGATSDCSWIQLWNSSWPKVSVSWTLAQLAPHPGWQLRAIAKWEFIPSCWKFSWPKAYSSTNRLCSLCSSFRGGSRSPTEGEWPQTWGIPLSCLQQQEAGSPQLPLLSKCPTLQPQIWMPGVSHNFWLKNADTFPLPYSTPKRAWQRFFHFCMSIKYCTRVSRSIITSVFLKLNKCYLKPKASIHFSSGKHWSISHMECAGGLT